MSCYLITYDLLTPSKDYKALYDQIKTYEAWWHHMESVWLVSTSKSLMDVATELKQYVDDKDNLLVIDVSGRERAGWLTRRAWDWMTTNNPKL